MSRAGYAGAWHAGFRAARRRGCFAIAPFWRGGKYRKAWVNGYWRGRL